MKFCITPWQADDGPIGRELLQELGAATEGASILMDCTYEGDATRQLAESLGDTPVVPPNPKRKEPWEYGKILYKRRNEVKRQFRRLKRIRRISTRYDKLDRMFVAFIIFAFFIRRHDLIVITRLNTTSHESY